MEILNFSEIINLLAVLAVAAAVAGFMAGLLGVGGGIIMVPALYYAFTVLDFDIVTRMHLSVGTSLAIIIPTSIISTKTHPSREQVVEKLLEYLNKEVKLGTKVNHIMRHTVGLYHGQVGSKEWKRYLSDNMMARDSDFQKAKHIMTIVQNNEKANQVSS